MGRLLRLAFLTAGLALILTGCFRQASEPAEEVGIPESQPLTQDNSSDMVEPTDTPGGLQVTTSTPFVVPTVGTPTEDSADTTGTDGTAVVPPPPGSGTSGSVNPVPLTNTTPTQPVLTPGLPSGPVTTSTATPGGVPSSTPSGLVTPTDLFTGDTTGSSCIYVVQPGDNLFRIAVSNDLTLDELRAANPDIVGDLIQPNDEINLPNCDETAAPTTGTQAPAAGGTPAPGGDQIIHIVVSGETLSTIAQQYGVTVLSIVQANNLTDPNRLSVGQELVIP